MPLNSPVLTSESSLLKDCDNNSLCCVPLSNQIISVSGGGRAGAGHNQCLVAWGVVGESGAPL